MNRVTAQKFAYCRSRLKGLDRLALSLLFHSAPVVFDTKPAALVNLGKPEGEPCTLWISHRRDFKEMLEKYLLKVREYRITGGSMLVFIYQPHRLFDILAGGSIPETLAGFGYKEPHKASSVLDSLDDRFSRSFPHELGLLLGYPPKDVTGFILNNGKHYLLNGYWKVYHNPVQALKTFGNYDKAGEKMLKLFGQIG